AGGATQAMIAALVPLLEPGDVLMDGGNAHYLDTQQRFETISAHGIHFLGVGISGGESGARSGPAMMVGGTKEAYDLVKPLLEQVVAHVDGEACLAYFGPKGAGHYVKMMHNGIEYAIMELIAEVFSVVEATGSRTATQAFFASLNQSIRASYLLDITQAILEKQSDGHYWLDRIENRVEQKGTGKWALEHAVSNGLDFSMLAAALRVRNQRSMPHVEHSLPIEDVVIEVEQLIATYENALLLIFDQAFALMKAGQVEYGWDLDFVEMAKSFRGGCIIQGTMMQTIVDQYMDQSIPLLAQPTLAQRFLDNEQVWRKTIVALMAQRQYIPLLAASLTYYDGVSAAHIESRILAAQRDYFGAHQVHLVDGTIQHLDWEKQDA
ncbi:MAG: NAD(P)-binding domain-containing protein, partial [Erysipelotrichaceae bacterium]